MRRSVPIRFRNQRGQSLVETALMIVVIFTITFWIFELAWLMYTYSVMADAANEGVRHAIVHSGGDVPGTTSVVQTFAGTSLHDLTNISISVTFPDNTAAPGHPVVVSITYTYVPWLKNLFSPPTMTTYAKGMMIAP